MENQVTIMQESPAPVAANAPVNILQYVLAQENVNIDALERIMALQEKTRQREAEAAFNSAMAEAKEQIPVIMKTKKVSFGDTKYSHEDLAEITKVLTPIISPLGLSYTWDTDYKDSMVIVTCVISHKSGYSKNTTLPAPIDTSGKKNAIQSIGSTVTYLQRYTLKAAFGLAVANDDDARFSGQGNMETITEEQATRLRELVEKTSTAIDKFCRFFKVQSVADIAAKDFKAAERQLLLKLEQGAK